MISREILSIGGFDFRTHSRCEGEIKKGRVRNVRRSAKTRREWGEMAQNQATRIDGRSVRIFTKSREILSITGFGSRTNPW